MAREIMIDELFEALEHVFGEHDDCDCDCKECGYNRTKEDADIEGETAIKYVATFIKTTLNLIDKDKKHDTDKQVDKLNEKLDVLKDEVWNDERVRMGTKFAIMECLKSVVEELLAFTGAIWRALYEEVGEI